MIPWWMGFGGGAVLLQSVVSTINPAWLLAWLHRNAPDPLLLPLLLLRWPSRRLVTQKAPSPSLRTPQRGGPQFNPSSRPAAIRPRESNVPARLAPEPPHSSKPAAVDRRLFACSALELLAAHISIRRRRRWAAAAVAAAALEPGRIHDWTGRLLCLICVGWDVHMKRRGVGGRSIPKIQASGRPPRSTRSAGS